MEIALVEGQNALCLVRGGFRIWGTFIPEDGGVDSIREALLSDVVGVCAYPVVINRLVCDDLATRRAFSEDIYRISICVMALTTME